MADTSASSEILLSAAVTTWLLLQIRRAADVGLEARLAKRTGRHQFADSRFVVAEDAFEDVLIVLAQHRRGATDDGRSARQFRARTFDREFAEARMSERDEVAAMSKLRIGVRVSAVLHLVAG